MPFKSKAQRKWMFANKPEMAERWEDHTPRGTKLPSRVKKAVALSQIRLLQRLATPRSVQGMTRRAVEDEDENSLVDVLQQAVLEKDAERRKPYRNRVDVYPLNSKGLLYSGTYPDGSIGLFGGGIDPGETAAVAGKRELLEEGGRRVDNVKRVGVPKFEESRLVRKGWAAAGKTERLKRYAGTRTFSVVGDLVKGKKEDLTEPSDHIKNIKFRTLPEAIKMQETAIANSKSGHKGILTYRLKALKMVDAMQTSNQKVASVYPRRQEQSKRQNIGSAVLGAGAGAAISRPLSWAADDIASHGLIDQGNAQGAPGLVKKLLKAEGGGHQIPLTRVPTESSSAYVQAPGPIRKKLQKSLSPKLQALLSRESILLPKKVNPFIAAHEVGHATGGRLAKFLMRNRGGIMAGSALGSVGLLGHAALTGKKGEGMGATGYAAPAVAAIAPLAIQGEELRATVKGKRLLDKAKIKVPRIGKMMRSQQLNYLLGNLGKVAPIGLGAFALHQALKKKDKPNA